MWLCERGNLVAQRGAARIFRIRARREINTSPEAYFQNGARNSIWKYMHWWIVFWQEAAPRRNVEMETQKVTTKDYIIIRGQCSKTSLLQSPLRKQVERKLFATTAWTSTKDELKEWPRERIYNFLHCWKLEWNFITKTLTCYKCLRPTHKIKWCFKRSKISWKLKRSKVCFIYLRNL